MEFDRARAQIIAAIHSTTGILNEPRMAGRAEDPTIDIAFSDLGLDSLAAMEICMELEEKAAVEIDLGDLAVYPSVNSLAKYVAAKSAKE